MEITSFSVLVNSDGRINRVLTDETHHQFLKENDVFVALFGNNNREAIHQLIADILNKHNNAGIRIKVNQSQLVQEYYLTGSLIEDACLILGMEMLESVPDIYFEDLIRINNEQMNTLRLVIKELVNTQQQTVDQQALVELTEVNNDLMQLQRRVSRQNADIDRQLKQIELLNQMNTELQRSDALDATFSIVTEYAQDLYPNSGGILYLFRNDVEKFEQRSFWGQKEQCEICLEKINQISFIEDLKELNNLQAIQLVLKEQLPNNFQFMAIPGHNWIIGILQLFPLRRPIIRDPFNIQYQEAFLQSVGLAISNMQMREHLRTDAIIDQLTDLYNRRFLDAQLIREISRAVRQRSMVSVVMIDLDHFKSVNDIHGHQVGDRLLIAFSQLLQNSIRKEDYACRFGGDEFTLILPDSTYEETMLVINRITADLWSITSEFPKIKFGFSYGVAGFPDHGENAKQILKMADHFLYEMKRKKEHN